MSWNIKTPGDYINGPLTVAGAVTLNSDLTVVNNITCNSEIYSLGGRLALYRTAGASYVDWSSGQNLIWRTVTSVGGGGAANQMWLNSTGLGIGAAPGVKLDVVGTIRSKSSAGDTSGLSIWSDASSNGNIFQYYNGPLIFGTNNTERARINSTGAFVFVGGTANANGIGIAFPSAQSASTDANTLDDYEEGTFTPTVSGSTTAGVGTYSVQSGRYSKIGNTVFVQVYLSWSAHTGTGNFYLTDLPFNSVNAGNAYSSIAIGEVSGIALTAGNYLLGSIPPNTNRVGLSQTPTGGGSASTVPIDANGYIIYTAQYQV